MLSAYDYVRVLIRLSEITQSRYEKSEIRDSCKVSDEAAIDADPAINDDCIPSRVTVYDWIRLFEGGRENLEDAVTSVTDEKIDAVQALGGRRPINPGINDSRDSSDTRWIFAFHTEGEAESEQTLCTLGVRCAQIRRVKRLMAVWSF